MAGKKNSIAATQDAKTLISCLDWKAGNQDVVIGLISSRTREQRQKIAVEYEDITGKSISYNMRLDPRFDFSRLIIALFMPPCEYDTQTVRNALQIFGTDEETLLEIFLSRSNREIQTIKEIYYDKYNRVLEDDLKKKTTGDFQKMIMKLAVPSRQHNAVVSEEKAVEDAKNLQKASKSKKTSSADIFIDIFCTRSYPQLVKIFEHYKKISGKEIEETIEKDFKNHMLEGLKAVAMMTRSQAGYFAHRLYLSMVGAGTRDDMLIRVIVTRCEEDMPEIKKCFLEAYGSTLEDYIIGDTTFSYMKLLLAMVQ